MKQLAKYRMRQFYKHTKNWKPLPKYLAQGKIWFDETKSYYPDESLFITFPGLLKKAQISHAFAYCMAAKTMERHEAVFPASVNNGILEPLYLSCYIFRYQFRAEYLKAYVKSLYHQMVLVRNSTILLEVLYPDWQEHFAQAVSRSR